MIALQALFEMVKHAFKANYTGHAFVDELANVKDCLKLCVRHGRNKYKSQKYQPKVCW